MKSLLVLFVAVGVSQAAVTCDECRATAQDLVSHLLSAESLAEQVQIMKDNVCPSSCGTREVHQTETKNHQNQSHRSQGQYEPVSELILMSYFFSVLNRV